MHFAVFWIGILLFIVPAGLRLMGRGPRTSERVALVTAVALLGTLPKILRSPSSPIFHDEFAHWWQVTAVRQTGRLFEANPIISVLKYFPGLHGLTALLQDLSGSHSFALAQVLIAALHVASLFGVFVLADAVFDSPRAGGVAAFIYALNPSFMYFDAQFAYETYAVVLLIWVLACAARMERATTVRGRVGWAAAGVVIALACLVTHHLTSLVLVQMLLLASAVALWRTMRRRTRREALVALVGFTALVGTAVATWIIVVATPAIQYLSGSTGPSVSQFVDLVLHRGHSRTLYQHSVTPVYERLAAFVTPLLLFAGVIVAVLAARRRPWSSSVGIGVGAYGLLYFASLPLALTASGAEGAGRSWSFSFIGLALLLASVLPRVFDVVRARLRAVAVTVGVGLAVAVVAVGSVSMLISPDYRFPGPFVYGSDALSVTPEVVSLEKWFSETQGRGRFVVSDRYTNLIFAGLGHEWTSFASDGFPVWELYFNPNGPSAALLGELQGSGWQYLIVDKRMYGAVPDVGIHTEGPDPYVDQIPPKSAYANLFRQPWLIPIIQTSNYTVFRFDFSALGHTPDGAATPVVQSAASHSAHGT